MRVRADIILPAGKIPDRSRVRKVTGQKVYVLRRDLKVFVERDDPDQHEPIEFSGIFLVPEDGNITHVPDHKLLVWIGRCVTVHEHDMPTDEEEEAWAD